MLEPQIVTNPKLVLIVGCCGLASNILGLFLFHEHGHSHQSAGHDHIEEENPDAAAEEGRSARLADDTDIQTLAVADEGGNVVDVLPESHIGGWSKTSTTRKTRLPGSEISDALPSREFSKHDEETSTAAGTASLEPLVKSNHKGGHSRHRRATSGSRTRFPNAESIPIRPASFRNDIIKASKLEDIESQNESDFEDENVLEDGSPNENSPLLYRTRTKSSARRKNPANYSDSHSHDKGNDHDKGHDHESLHAGHNHRRPKEGKQDTRSHGDLNVRGVFLHVMGDALGNIGVIASALFIWCTDYKWRYYSDPIISLVITVIILGSAIPLCKAASRILLQAVPLGINVDDIKEDIEDLEGIISCHHLHVWQLSDTKLVASLHIQVEFDIKGEGSARYMHLAKAVRHCLHGYGIHSSTIQPEFCLDSKHRHSSGPASDDDTAPDHPSKGSAVGSRPISKGGSMRSAPDNCLLDCDDRCGDGKQCCAPGVDEDKSKHAH